MERETCRKVLTKSLKLVFPYEAKEKEDSIPKIDEFLRSGYGMVFVINHFSLRDFFSILERLVLESKEIPGRDIIIPIAQHQNHNGALSKLVDWGGVKLCPIVTQETKIKEKEMESVEKTIPWDIQDVGSGNLQYLKNASNALKDGGVVIVAPQGTRKPYLEPFDNNSITALMTLNKRNKAEKVGFVYVGIGNTESQDYTQSGFNVRDRYSINMSSPITSHELAKNAQENGQSLELEVYSQMLKLVPQSYRPKC